MEANIKLMYDGHDVSDFVTSVTWSGETAVFNRSLNVDILAGVKAEVGKLVEFYNNGVKLFRGVLFEFSINAKETQSWTCYDEGYYLTKSTDSRLVTNQTASAFLRKLCADFGVATSTIDESGYVIKVLTLENKSLNEMVKEVLDITRKQTGRKFRVATDANGKVTMRQVKATTALDVTHLLTDANYSQSIEETKTQVKVIGGKDDKFVSIAKSNALAQKIGIMQELENMDEEATASQVKQRADELLRQLAVINDEADVELLGDDRVVTGAVITLNESVTGIRGKYTVLSDSHSYANGVHTMSLTISAGGDV